jgi:hypothetical protein
VKSRAVLRILLSVAGLFLLGALLVPLLSSERTTRTDLEGTVRRVEVTSDRGAVTVRAGTPAVESRRRYILSAPRVRQTLADGVMRVEVSCPGWAFASCSADVVVTAPAGAEVAVDSTRGTVTVDGFRGPVNALSEDGDVRIDGRGAAIVEARTVTGAVDVRLASPATRLVARSETGDVRVRIPAGDYRLDVVSARGAVAVADPVRAAPGAARSVEARSGLGDVTLLSG